MSKKENIKIEKLGPYDQFEKISAADALKAIYEHAEKYSGQLRSWYWTSIAKKKKASVYVLFVSFLLLVCGAVLPIVAGISDDIYWRLKFTQFGVASLAAAGLLRAADRVFGWSSGWLRYISTVTAMESITRKFELEWASYMINKNGDVTSDDKRPLFEMARQLENDLSKLQSDETDKWVTEFNSSLALLSELIKSQRESSEKANELVRSTIAAREKAQQQGGIEVSIVHKAEPVAVGVHMDNDPETAFTGKVWSKLQVAPGHHTVHVTTMQPPIYTIQKTVDVQAGGIERVEVRLS